MNTSIVIFSAVAFVFLSIAIPSFDYEKRIQEYCNNVKIYESELHFDYFERGGHPNYKKVDCDKRSKQRGTGAVVD